MTYLQIVFHKIKLINRKNIITTINHKKLTSLLENDWNWNPIYNERNVDIATEKFINIIQTEINNCTLTLTQEKRRKTEDMDN